MAGLRREFIHECRNGHPYDAANTRTASDGRRTCRTCARARAAVRAARRRVERERAARAERQAVLAGPASTPLLAPVAERQLRAAVALPACPAGSAVEEFQRLRALGIDAPRAHLLALTAYQRRQRPGRIRSPREHGSERGWRQHRTDGAPACRACRAAHSRHNLAARIVAVPVVVSA